MPRLRIPGDSFSQIKAKNLVPEQPDENFQKLWNSIHIWVVLVLGAKYKVKLSSKSRVELGIQTGHMWSCIFIFHPFNTDWGWICCCFAQVGPPVVPHGSAAFLCSGWLRHTRGAAGGQGYSAEKVGGLPQLVPLHLLSGTCPEAGGRYKTGSGLVMTVDHFLFKPVKGVSSLFIVLHKDIRWQII